MANDVNLSSSGLIGAAEAAKLLGTTIGYVWRLAYLKQVRCFRIGRGSFYLRTEIEAYRDSHPRVGVRVQAR